jgi:hypothetical protein
MIDGHWSLHQQRFPCTHVFGQRQRYWELLACLNSGVLHVTVVSDVMYLPKEEVCIEMIGSERL